MGETKQGLKSWEELAEKMKVYIDRQKKEEGERMERLLKICE
jgi:hypothetical protein